MFRVRLSNGRIYSEANKLRGPTADRHEMSLPRHGILATNDVVTVPWYYYSSLLRGGFVPSYSSI